MVDLLEQEVFVCCVCVFFNSICIEKLEKAATSFLFLPFLLKNTGPSWRHCCKLRDESKDTFLSPVMTSQQQEQSEVALRRVFWRLPLNDI